MSARLGAPPPREALASVDCAIKALRKFDRAFAVPRRRSGEEAAARQAAAAMGMRGSASEAMLEWALDAAPRLAGDLRYVINQEQYDKLCGRFSRELLRAWNDKRGEKLGFGPAARAVDLVMMALGESESCRRQSATGFLRVPLDARTLAPLRLVVDELTGSDYSVEIPAKPSAGYVVTEEQYYVLEGAIFELARRAGMAPIVYAYWCASG